MLTGGIGDDVFIIDGAIGSHDRGNIITDFGDGANVLDFTAVASGGTGILADTFQAVGVSGGTETPSEGVTTVSAADLVDFA